MRPPSEASRLASARAIEADPPSATGHSSTCPVRQNTSPTAAVRLRSRGRIECAAQPAKSARARSPRKRPRARPVAERIAARPKRSMRSGCLGIRSGPRMSSRRPCGSREQGREEALVGARVGAERARRLGERPAQQHRGLDRRADGPRTREAGPSAARAPRAASVRKKGERIPIGWHAEHTSWRNPGSVSSLVRVPPPGSSRPSSTTTDAPSRASATAAASPFGPEPTTTASASRGHGAALHGWRARAARRRAEARRRSIAPVFASTMR